MSHLFSVSSKNAYASIKHAAQLLPEFKGTCVQSFSSIFTQFVCLAILLVLKYSVYRSKILWWYSKTADRKYYGGTVKLLKFYTRPFFPKKLIGQNSRYRTTKAATQLTNKTQVLVWKMFIWQRYLYEIWHELLCKPPLQSATYFSNRTTIAYNCHSNWPIKINIYFYTFLCYMVRNAAEKGIAEIKIFFLRIKPFNYSW